MAPQLLEMVAGRRSQVAVVSSTPKSSLQLFASHPTGGAYRDRHGRGVECGGRGSVLRARRLQGGFFESVSDWRAGGREMLLRTAKSCGPDAPTLASSSRSCVGPTGLKQNISVSDGGKRARSPGRARRKPLKPLRAGMPGDSGVLVVARVRSITTRCTRGRGCNGHPAFPTPSKGAEDKRNASGASRREDEGVCGIRATSLRGA